jgi:hypothetical protein
VEAAECREALQRVLADPTTTSPFEREWEERAGAGFAAAIVDVVPEVAADRVRLRRLFDRVDVVRMRVVEEARERFDRGSGGASRCVRTGTRGDR